MQKVGRIGIEECLRADREKVVHFVEHLRKAFEDYVNAQAEKGKEHEIRFPEALMAVHNFHKLIVLDVEERSGIKDGADARAIQAYRRMWVTTFEIALLGTDEEKAAIKAKNDS
jgi:DNA-binding SARP family transcriptional activator